MRIACLGGGPAGLYFAISHKLRDPAAHVAVFERNRAGDTFGWGVVFSDQTVENLLRNDPISGRTIVDRFAHWDDIEVRVGEERVRSSGHGFIGIGRKKLLEILTERARELGVSLHFEHPFEGADDFPDYDLVVAADGVNSRVRDTDAQAFGVDIDVRRNKFIWLGTAKTFDAFTFAFERTAAGWVWAHAYRFDDELSTFIVECDEATWRALGFDEMDQEETCRTCERIFARHLDGHELMSNAAHLRGSAAWLNFRRVLCERWSAGKVVLLGDAAHTAHFSIGSGTKLALEDAIKLAEVLNRPGLSRADALAEYEAERRVEVLKLQNSARNSTEWFETLGRYLHFEPIQFAYSLLTRSQRVSHENLRLRDPAWLNRVEAWFAEAAGAPADGRPPMFAPYRLREMALANRIVVSPMATYSAGPDATPNDFHLVHYGARAQGGAGLVFTEMTCVSPEGRITPGCTGMWTDAHADAWGRIAEFVHRGGEAKFCLQLGHSGAKGSTRIGWEGMDQPLAGGGWDLLGPAEVAWSPGNSRPRAMTRDDMERVRDQFVRAVRLAERAGFDMVELHAAHGYLLSGFITPLQNRRDDDYGGPLENRLRFPLEVFRAMRDAWPSTKPMSVRISANDWAGEDGVTPAEAVEIARAFAQAGCDLIDVSAGQTWADARPVYGRMFQTPFSDRIRNEARLSTMAVGNIFEADHVNSILAAGRADLVALARPHLVDPYWTLKEAARAGYEGVAVPKPYMAGQQQLARNLRRAAEQAEALRA
ncbi:bifunctional salicylyl-CoA 5-hydroxylase/oxidoreductase [Sphingomonas lenta]|uniref:Oxidoreductase n=1 Tax=Sphingomonas lenta TaxID=1141887 RepID=A0A2A2SBY2_9SPHN|nr:bifunctional salicylyl-CoA 5-hydroxylase/oxidoreductase [Sphingomonas lenta]PAX06766.1 oxidoreductase [Sphingomonas lenta]